jgi:hypothetical protein
MEATGKAQPAEKDVPYHAARRDLCITNIRPVSGLMVCTCINADKIADKKRRYLNYSLPTNKFAVAE